MRGYLKLKISDDQKRCRSHSAETFCIAVKTVDQKRYVEAGNYASGLFFAVKDQALPMVM
jgi:hypothetical protein